ncbi:MAG TPA: DUF4189 domain-containing protein [Xanthobacteraceae bacterium]
MSRLRMAGTLMGVLALMPWSTRAMADNYGAIAFSQSTGAHGYSNDYRTRAAAERRALEECGRDCEVVLWFVNACGALATGDDNGYGTGWAGGRRAAEAIALSACHSNATNCGILRWVCTTR